MLLPSQQQVARTLSDAHTGPAIMRLAKEPLIHFLAAAGLIFWINANYSGDGRELIEIDPATIDYLVSQEEDLRLRPLSEQEREEFLEQFIDDEILVREARKRGYDDSSRIRTLLIQNMRFFIKQDLPAPGVEVLRAYFETNIERFTRPPSLDMEQVYFEDAGSIPENLLEELNSGADFTRLGDATIKFGNLVRNVTERNIAASFHRESAEAILAIADDRWHGPFQSDYGAHFLRVIRRNPAAVPAFEQAGNWLETQWIADQQLAAMEEALQEMRPAYRVEFLQTGESPE